MPTVTINLTTTNQAGITAFAGGGQANAVALTKTYNRVDTVATNGDSVKMLNAIVGLRQVVYNNGVADLNLYPFLGDNFAGYAANAPMLIVAGQKFDGFCFVNGEWAF